MVARVDDYLAARRHTGFDLGVAGRQLLSFARFADQAGHEGPLTFDAAVRWAQSARGSTRLTWARRLEVLRPFARYLVQFDANTAVIPARFFGAAHRRLAPHIYTEHEIVDLLHAANDLTPTGGLRPQTYQTLFGVLAATGLRLSEALHLKMRDVEADRLTVRQTKFRKSRLVPVHVSTARALARYATVRDRTLRGVRIETFFVSGRGEPLAARTVESTFQTLRAQLGWVARGGHAWPRLHDLRHTFICHGLLRSYREGHPADHVIDALSTYVGHARVSDTYWYVTATPELMAIAAQRFESLAADGGAS
jgi:integrase